MVTVTRLKDGSIFVLSSHSHAMMQSYLLTPTLLPAYNLGCRAFFFDSGKKKQVRNFKTIKFYKCKNKHLGN